MKKLSSVIAAAAFVGAAMLPMQSAQAWWGGPGGWGNGGGPWSAMTDMFGGGDINFNAKSYGHGTGRGYAQPYYGYGYGAPYYGYGYGYPGYGYGGYPGYGYGVPAYGVPVAPVVPAAPAQAAAQ